MLVLDMTLYLAAALISAATRFTTILGAVALCYNIFVYSVEYLDIAFSHYIYFQQPGNIKPKASCVTMVHQAYKILCSHNLEESQKSYFKELKDSLVSVFMFVHLERDSYKYVFPAKLFLGTFCH
jgi:hypothetical protein